MNDLKRLTDLSVEILHELSVFEKETTFRAQPDPLKTPSEPLLYLDNLFADGKISKQERERLEGWFIGLIKALVILTANVPMDDKAMAQYSVCSGAIDKFASSFMENVEVQGEPS